LLNGLLVGGPAAHEVIVMHNAKRIINSLKYFLFNKDILLVLWFVDTPTGIENEIISDSKQRL
jgi:hypothetical protein